MTTTWPVLTNGLGLLRRQSEITPTPKRPRLVFEWDRLSLHPADETAWARAQGMIVEVHPVFDPRVRGLCGRSYPGHPKGCPNVNHKAGCPPAAPFLPEVFDLSQPTFLIVHRFDLGGHVERMRAAHPGWSQRQLVCCLYWQAGARKQLEQEIDLFKMAHPRLGVTRCPEAMGLNVTETLRAAGIEIEWPPTKWALQVAMAGTHASTETQQTGEKK